MNEWMNEIYINTHTRVRIIYYYFGLYVCLGDQQCDNESFPVIFIQSEKEKEREIQENIWRMLFILFIILLSLSFEIE